MDKFLEQIRALLRGLTVNQRFLLAGSAVLVGLILWLFVRPFGAADFKNLYTGLDPTDTQKIIQRLSLENIAYQLSTDGTSIDVPADQPDRVRVEMASQSLPHTGLMGFELFDKPNWSSSDFSERMSSFFSTENPKLPRSNTSSTLCCPTAISFSAIPNRCTASVKNSDWSICLKPRRTGSQPNPHRKQGRHENRIA
jgi:hypothetical protein